MKLSFPGILSWIACCFWAPFFVSAQNTLSGTIINSSTHEKVSGAVLQIEGSYLTTLSDNSGHFEIKNLRQTTLVLTVTHVTFTPQQVIVSLPSAPLEVNLVPRIITAEEVTVTALRVDENSAIAHSTINKKEIESNNLGQDIPYLLNLTPSAVATSDAGNGVGYTGLRIRGSDPTRVNVTINGIPVNDPESQAVYWVDLPDFASSTESVQIQRGIGSSTNGAGAFGASVNMQSTGISDKPYGTISSSAGSFSTLKNSFSFGTGMMKKFSFEGRFSVIKSDGFIDRSASNLKSLFLSGGYTSTKSSLRLIIFTGSEKTDQAWYGVPEAKLFGDNAALTDHYYRNLGSLYFTQEDSINLFSSDPRKYNYYTYENQTDNYRQDNYQLHYALQLNKYWNANVALHYTKGSGFYEEYRYQDALSGYGISPEIIGGDTISTSDIVRQRWLDNDFTGTVYSLQYKKDKLGVILGGAWNYYSGDHYGKITWAEYAATFPINFEYYRDKASKYDFNSYLKISWHVIDKLDLFADLQYRRVDYSFAGYDNALQQNQQQVLLNFFNPKAGAFYRLSPHQSLYVSASVGHKEPSRDDYTDAPANTRPKPESMLDLEAGYKINADKYMFGINLFDMIYHDQLVVTGFINDIGLYPRQNVDNSFRRGIELEASIKISRSLKFDFNAAASQNEIKDYNEYLATYDSVFNYTGQIVRNYKNSDLAFSPSFTGAGALVYTPVSKLDIHFIGKYVGQQYLDNTSSSSRLLKPYFISDIRVNYSLAGVIGNGVDFTFAVYNIFNRQYESNGYTYSYLFEGRDITENYYYPQAGTHFLAGIKLSF